MNPDRLASMPKVELHLHLEGAIPLGAMWELVQRSGGDPEVPDPEAFTRRLAYRDFAHFIDTWVWKNRYLRDLEAFEYAAAAVAGSLAEQRIVYAEAFFSPTDFAHHGMSPQDLAVAIRRGLDSVTGTEVRLVADLVRDTGPGRAMRTFDQVREVAGEAGVIGIGIGGSEAEYPPGQFRAVYRKAEAAGFHRTAHAGEAAGPESIRGTLDALGVERIGHGVQAAEDPALLEELVTRQVPLEVCPTSNLRTGVVASWERHPVGELLAAGALVTLNTDDPAMFACSLAGEYREVAARFGLGGEALLGIARNGIAASWAPPARKQELAAELDRWWSGDP